eukprot:m.75295 g.75295  ORF g.75295 m.75295 type:complete len:59 (+) comp12493_c0_seq2:311-487(+)
MGINFDRRPNLHVLLTSEDKRGNKITEWPVNIIMVMNDTTLPLVPKVGHVSLTPSLML